MNNPKRIPYGMMNFVALREENCYYVDKTRFVEEIEHANMYFFYIRPRRFGKSLTLSMLRHYYDVNEADKFETWFKGLYIGEHPTPLHNSYLVLYFNFSVVNGEISSYRESMDSYCNTVFTSFCEKYSRLVTKQVKVSISSSMSMIISLIQYFQRLRVKMTMLRRHMVQDIFAPSTTQLSQVQIQASSEYS